VKKHSFFKENNINHKICQIAMRRPASPFPGDACLGGYLLVLCFCNIQAYMQHTKLKLVFWLSGLVFWMYGLVFWVSGFVFGVSGFLFWVFRQRKKGVFRGLK